jgi:amino acid transporter
MGDHSKGIAAILSLFIPGLGQIYCGRVLRGLLWMIFLPVLTAVVIALTFFGSLISFFGGLVIPSLGLGAIAIFFPVVMWVINIFDASSCAGEEPRKKYRTTERNTRRNKNRR